MGDLFRFSGVRCLENSTRRDFTLHAGEIRLMQLATRHEKNVMIDCAIGEVDCKEGSIEIARSDRRRSDALASDQAEERRHNQDPMPLIWQPVMDNMQKDVAWVASNGGLISNLKIWENVTLPMWYHSRRDVIETEQRVLHWLEILGLSVNDYSEFMASQPFSLESWQRKLAGLLRALMQMPRVLVVDAIVFEDVKSRLVECWTNALEAYAGEGRSVLVLTDKVTNLSWERIEAETE